VAYTITGRKCGAVRFEQTSAVKDTSKGRSSQVTSNPVEDGSEIQDHHVNQPAQFSFNGVTVGGDEAYNRLEKMQEQHDLLTYAGKFRMNNLVITSLQRTDNKDNADGCSFSAAFQQVQIGSAEYVKAGETPMMSAQDAGKPKAASASQTSATKSEGLVTTSTTKLTDAAYLDYVDSYGAKAPASSGPSSGLPATSGLR
jgi:hypothetical protein